MGRSLGRAYGLGGGTLAVFPPPVLAQRAPASSDTQYPEGQVWIDNSVSPNVIYLHSGAGDWDTGGNAVATTTTFGIVILNDSDTMAGATDEQVPTALAIKTYADNLAIAGSPVSTETTAGIGQLATNAEAVAGTPSTGALALFVTPSNLASVFAAPPAIGGTTPAGGTFTFIAASATGTGNTLVSDTASLFDVTGAGIDLTLSSDAGRVIVNGEEAAANAITLLSAAGGIDADAALQINIATSQNAADAIVINASAGGIDITAAGAATEDIDITNTAGSIRLVAGESAADSIVLSSTNGGIDILASGAAAGEDIDISTSASVNITSTENNSGAIIVQANGGASERVTLLASQGTGADSINLESTAGGITLSAALASADAINLSASAGGVDIDGALQVNIASSQNAGDAIRIVASAGGIDVDAVGAAGEDISIVNTGGSLILQATESDVNAIVINASGAAGGINIDAGTSGFIVDTTGGISLDSAAASNFTATGAFDITIQSTAGSILLNAGEAAADAINIDSTGGFDLDAALQINIDSSQAAAANSIRVNASAADGGIDVDAGTGGITIDTTGAISVDSATASNLTVTGAGQDLTLAATGGSVKINSTEDAAGAIALSANGGTSETITITAAQGTGAASISLSSTAGGVTIAGGLATADAINLAAASGGVDIDGALQVNIASSQDAADAIRIVASAGGIDIDAVGAAGQDIVITNTGGSVSIVATEDVSDAFVLNCSGAASGASIDAGTAGLTIGTGLVLAVTNVATAATPYAVLGTDYIINTDSTGGALEITLPGSPVTGRTLVVYDGAGQAAAGGNVTINGNGNNIAAAGSSAATKVINTAYESYTLYYNGTIWMGQNIV